MWWFLGPLTLLPLAGGREIDWSYANAANLSGALVGHILYGLIVGLVYAFIDRLWVRFFSESDPINREPEGPGLRAWNSLKWGAVASLVGGLLYSMVLLSAGYLPKLAMLAGGSSAALGFVVNMVGSAGIGISYGLLFQREAPNAASGLCWGTALRHDLVVCWSPYAAAAVAHRFLRLESRSGLGVAAVAHRPPSVRSRHGERLSPAGAPARQLAIA
jgi:hypothetical protein